MSIVKHVFALASGSIILAGTFWLGVLAATQGFAKLVIFLFLAGTGYLVGRIFMALLGISFVEDDDGPTQADYHAGAA